MTIKWLALVTFFSLSWGLTHMQFKQVDYRCTTGVGTPHFRQKFVSLLNDSTGASLIIKSKKGETSKVALTDSVGSAYAEGVNESSDEESQTILFDKTKAQLKVGVKTVGGSEEFSKTYSCSLN